MEPGVVGGVGGQLYLSSQGTGMVRGGAIATPVVSVTGPNGLALSGYPPAFQGLSPSTYFSSMDRFSACFAASPQRLIILFNDGTAITAHLYAISIFNHFRYKYRQAEMSETNGSSMSYLIMLVVT